MTEGFTLAFLSCLGQIPVERFSFFFIDFEVLFAHFLILQRRLKKTFLIILVKYKKIKL